MNRFFRAVTLLVVLISCRAAAQTPGGSLEGVVAGADGKPFNLATVVLLKYADSAALKTVFTDSDGKFGFRNIPGGQYRLLVTASGYQAFKSDAVTITGGSLYQLPDTITLRPLAKEGEGVTVTGRKPFIEQKIDRVVVNVESLVGNAGTTAMDVLSKSPGVMVDPSGNISLKGKAGVMILIDNKPTYLSGDDLKNYLSSIPSAQLGTIEIMTNPPARYDAAGNAGIINIKLKRIKTKGFNGSISANAAAGQTVASNNSINLNYRYNKVNAFANIGFGIGNNFQDLDINRRFLNTDGSTKSFFNQNNYTRFTNGKVNIKAGMDLYLSDRTIIGTVLTGLFFNGTDKDNNLSILADPGNTVYSTVQALNRKDKLINNRGANFNLRHTFKDKKQEITLDADYINYDNRMSQRFINIIRPVGMPSGTEYLDGHLPAQLNIYVAGLNYSNAIKGGWNFDAGLKTSYIKTDNRADYYNITGGIPAPDYDLSNFFRYRENISAAYVNMNHEMGKFSMQTGLRLETTTSRGRQLGNPLKPDSSFVREYTNLFPTVYLQYVLDSAGRHVLGLNYGRRIDRPFYQDLNPFQVPFDKFTFYSGNPFLLPAFTNSFQLSYTLNQAYTASFSYSKADDEVFETIEIEDTIYYSRPGNIGKKDVFSFSLSGAVALFKKLTVNFYGEVTHLKAQTRLNTGNLNASGTYVYLGPTLQMPFKKGWTAEMSFVYLSDAVNAQLKIGSYWQMGAGLQKVISQKLTAKLNATDIFYTFVNRGVISNLDKTDANYRGLLDTRRVGLTLNYKFGKAISNLKRHNTTMADEEKKRVKN